MICCQLKCPLQLNLIKTNPVFLRKISCCSLFKNKRIQKTECHCHRMHNYIILFILTSHMDIATFDVLKTTQKS